MEGGKVDIWMPLYVRDYLGATSRLTTEQHGAYMLIIMDYWLNGPPPDEDSILASIARLSLEQWSKHRPSIERLFSIHAGEWVHKRIDREIESAKDRKKQAIERGKRGAKARWAKNDGASIEQASDKQSSKDSSSPSSSPTPSPKPSKTPKANGAKAPAVELPDFMPADSWSDFLKFRKQIKAPMTDRAQELAFKKLATLKEDGNDPVAVIEQSMINGWKGLFEAKGPKKSPAKAAQEYRTQRQRIISQ